MVVSSTLIFVFFLGISDFLTGYELSFSIFYLLPISFITVYLGYMYGILTSILCSIAWFLADIYSGAAYSNMLIPYWNTFVRLIYFSLHSIILGNLIERMNQSKIQSNTDPLTGMPNFRHFSEFATKEIERARRSRTPITISYIDLDNFKSVNDKFGHSTGDMLLKIVADTLMDSIRPNDIASRVGGDEFIILLSGSDFLKSSKVLKRIQKVLLSEMKANHWPVTFSMGAITFNTIPLSLDRMIQETDKIMYSVKNSGKNNLKHFQKPRI